MGTTTTSISRRALVDPDYGYDYGVPLHTLLRNLHTELGDDLISRWTGSQTLADTAFIDVVHNFGLTAANLDLIIFEGNARITDEAIATDYTITYTDVNTTRIHNTSGGSKTFNATILGKPEPTSWGKVELTAGSTIAPLRNTVYTNATGTFTTVLPAVADSIGRVLFFKKTTATGTWTLDGASAEEIDGATTYDLTNQYEFVCLCCDGTQWNIISETASSTLSGADDITISGPTQGDVLRYDVDTATWVNRPKRKSGGIAIYYPSWSTSSSLYIRVGGEAPSTYYMGHRSISMNSSGQIAIGFLYRSGSNNRYCCAMIDADGEMNFAKYRTPTISGSAVSALVTENGDVVAFSGANSSSPTAYLDYMDSLGTEIGAVYSTGSVMGHYNFAMRLCASADYIYGANPFAQYIIRGDRTAFGSSWSRVAASSISPYGYIMDFNWDERLNIGTFASAPNFDSSSYGSYAFGYLVDNGSTLTSKYVIYSAQSSFVGAFGGSSTCLGDGKVFNATQVVIADGSYRSMLVVAYFDEANSRNSHHMICIDTGGVSACSKHEVKITYWKGIIYVFLEMWSGTSTYMGKRAIYKYKINSSHHIVPIGVRYDYEDTIPVSSMVFCDGMALSISSSQSTALLYEKFPLEEIPFMEYGVAEFIASPSFTTTFYYSLALGLSTVTPSWSTESGYAATGIGSSAIGFITGASEV